jgi:hypothetical protein
MSAHSIFWRSAAWGVATWATVLLVGWVGACGKTSQSAGNPADGSSGGAGGVGTDAGTGTADADAGASPPTCPATPPTNASSCGSTNMTCFYDNCPGTSRTQAACAGGTWTVQSAACGKVSCNGPSLLTCPSGQICLITEAGSVGAQCVDNACDQGPVSPQCGTSLSLCSMNATLTSGVTITCNTCPQGGCA